MKMTVTFNEDCVWYVKRSIEKRIEEVITERPYTANYTMEVLDHLADALIAINYNWDYTQEEKEEVTVTCQGCLNQPASTRYVNVPTCLDCLNHDAYEDKKVWYINPFTREQEQGTIQFHSSKITFVNGSDNYAYVLPNRYLERIDR